MPSKTPAAPGFFKSIPASIYSPSFYAGIAKRSFWKGFWFHVGFTFLTMLLGAVLVLGVPYFTHREEISQGIDKVLHAYPAELEITIQDGKASANVEQPYFVKINELISTQSWEDEFKEGFIEGMDVKEGTSLDELSLMVIDTSTPFSMEQFRDYKTIAWLTADAIYVLSENNNTEIIPLAEAEDIVINKTLADEGMDTIWASVQSFLPIGAVLIFIVSCVFVILGHLIYLVFFSLFMLIVFRAMKLPYDYAAGYKIGFYAMSLSSLIGILFLAFGLNEFLLMGTLINLLVAVVNFDQAKKRGSIAA